MQAQLVPTLHNVRGDFASPRDIFVLILGYFTNFYGKLLYVLTGGCYRYAGFSYFFS